VSVIEVVYRIGEQPFSRASITRAAADLNEPV
jgi:hypothetical protein